MTVGQDTRSGLVRFGVFEADLKSGELRKNGLKVRLPGQPFEVLALMLERPGEVVTREELQKRLWPDGTFVDFDHSLNNAINKIREALGDSAESPRFVETRSRRGYRFIAPVETRVLRVAQVPSDAGTGTSLDLSVSQPVERSSQLSENEADIEPPVPAGPVTVRKPHWLSQRRKVLVAILALFLLVALLFWWLPPRPTPLGQPLLTRLTSDPGLTTDAVVSPDGKLIAYASDRGGSNLDIWIRQVSGGDPLRLTQDPADDHQPSFSPDGSQIVFRSEREGGGIYIVSALAGDDRLLTPKGRNPRFSPAGDWIAFWDGALVGAAQGAQSGRIYLLPSTGGSPRQIEANVISAGCPIWSPDGNHLLFYGNAQLTTALFTPTSDWWVWPVAGGNAVKTGAFEVFAAEKISLTLPSPVPGPSEWRDDQVFFSAKTGDSVNLWQVSISPKNWQVTGPAHRLTTGPGLEIRPSLAKTGLLVFSSLVENADIWSLPIEASQGRVKGPLEQLTRDLAADYSPSISADGRKLAFVSLRSGNQDIWMKDLEIGKERPLTDSPAVETSPRISPDGTLVSYSIVATRDDKGPGVTYLAPSKGGLHQKLCDGCGWPWGWSHDNGVVFLKRCWSGDLPPVKQDWTPEGDRGMRLIKVASGTVSDYLQSSNSSLWNAQLTTDGRWITFNAMDRQASQLRLSVVAARFQLEIPPKESDWIQVVRDSHWNDKPRWSPDGNRIYFVSDRDGFACLWMQQVEPETKQPVGPPSHLYHLHEARRSIQNVGAALMDISVSPDKIVLNLGEVTGNIWMTQLPGN